MNTQLPRRRFLAYSLASAGLLTTTTARPASTTELLVPNITGLYSIKVAAISTPRNAQEAADQVRKWPGRIAVGGGRYSMGGQIAIRAGLHLDMRSMNRLVWLKEKEKRVRVQAGMCWRDLQDIIDPHDLAVMTMQSYSNFSIGGSVAVNVHGRYVGNGPLCNSVLALQVVLADGSIVEASASENTDLFRAAFGSYGAIGVVTEVELRLTDNIRMERIVQSVPLDQYPEFFSNRVAADKSNIMHNADLLPPAFDAPISVTWRTTDKPLTENARLIPRGLSYTAEKNMIWAATELPFGQNLQNRIRPMMLEKPAVAWRNHEASLDVASLEPRTRLFSTYVLQEYFIPPRHFRSFARTMAKVLQKHDVEALNISIRHAPADTTSILPWAKEEVFSFVLYYKQRTYAGARDKVAVWTRELIDLAIAHEGRYYLPYQLHATRQQFQAAYPEAAQLSALKNRFDPGMRFLNEMWHKYL